MFGLADVEGAEEDAALGFRDSFLVWGWLEAGPR